MRGVYLHSRVGAREGPFVPRSALVPLRRRGPAVIGVSFGSAPNPSRRARFSPDASARARVLFTSCCAEEASAADG